MIALSLLLLAASGDEVAGICPVQPPSAAAVSAERSAAERSAAVVERKRGPDTAPRSLRAFMREIGAAGGALDNPCVDVRAGEGCACARTALEPFFASLDGSSVGGSRTGIVALGNSLIAADGITDVVRARLVARFADGGRGLLLADRLGTAGPRARTAKAAHGWRVEMCATGEPSTVPFGAAGVHHVSEGRALSRFPLDGESEVAVFWVDHAESAALSFSLDDGPWQPLERRGPGPRVSELDIAPSARSLALRADGPGAVVQGVTIDRPGGVVLDVLGVPSADANLWLIPDEETFSTQLAQRAPSLVMLMLGGNETKRISWGRSTRASIDADLRALVRRVRKATDAACLVVGPIDAVVGPSSTPTADEDPWRQRSPLDDVIAIERAAALDEGCAFFDLYAAMGGRGSLKRLHDAGALLDDLVHPRGRGLDMLGQLLADALLNDYARTPIPPRQQHARGTSAP